MAIDSSAAFHEQDRRTVAGEACPAIIDSFPQMYHGMVRRVWTSMRRGAVAEDYKDWDHLPDGPRAVCGFGRWLAPPLASGCKVATLRGVTARCRREQSKPARGRPAARGGGAGNAVFGHGVLCAGGCSPARCGVVYVPENQSSRADEIVNVIVLPQAVVTDHQRAQYDLEGGPGFAATDFLEFYAGEGAPYRVSRDVVLADMRGTGKSNPLRCFGIEEREKRQPGLPMYPPDLVAECARQSSIASDPGQYSTGAAAQDIELIRQALGYEKLDLNAISYGTTLALRYMAEFPKRVHAAVLMGTVPARFCRRVFTLQLPRHHRRCCGECAADANCRTQSGDVNANLIPRCAGCWRFPP